MYKRQDDYRADDADGLTEAGMERMIEWLHNVKAGQVALKTDVVMCNLLAYEIERLRGENRDLKEAFSKDQDRIIRQNNRIAELEAEIDNWRIGNMCHHITDAQLKAAVKYAKESRSGGWEMEAAIWAVLEKLGFERCDEPECRGGVIQHLETPLEPGDDYGWNQTCPDCNGIGAIVSKAISAKRSADDE